MFSEKDYEKIAEILRKCYEDSLLSVEDHFNEAVDDLIDYFKADNPNFSEEKFIKACRD